MQNDPMTPQPEMTPQQMMQMQQQMMQMQMQQQQQQMLQQQPRKTGSRTRGVAAALALFLGGLGAHKFYLGQAGQGILYFLFCWTFIPVFIAFLDMIIYMVQSDQEFDQKYNYS